MTTNHPFPSLAPAADAGEGILSTIPEVVDQEHASAPPDPTAPPPPPPRVVRVRPTMQPRRRQRGGRTTRFAPTVTTVPSPADTAVLWQGLFMEEGVQPLQSSSINSPFSASLSSTSSSSSSSSSSLSSEEASSSLYPTGSSNGSSDLMTDPGPLLLRFENQVGSGNQRETVVRQMWGNMFHLVDRLLLRDVESDIIDAVAHESLQTYECKSMERDESRVLLDAVYREYDPLKDRLARCFICYEDWQAGDLVTELAQCRHIFHRPCIAEAIMYRDRCPICRTTQSVCSSSSASAMPTTVACEQQEDRVNE